MAITIVLGILSYLIRNDKSIVMVFFKYRVLFALTTHNIDSLIYENHICRIEYGHYTVTFYCNLLSEMSTFTIFKHKQLIKSHNFKR